MKILCLLRFPSISLTSLTHYDDNGHVVIGDITVIDLVALVDGMDNRGLPTKQ
jgi:hypothetical protein